MLEKIAEGTVQKFLKEVTLLGQVFVKAEDGKQTVAIAEGQVTADQEIERLQNRCATAPSTSTPTAPRRTAPTSTSAR